MTSNYPPFDVYKDEFSDHVKQIEQCLHADDDEQDDDDVSDLISQCETLLGQMALEVRGAPKDLKQDLKDILEACQMQFQSYQTLNDKKELFSAKSNTERLKSTQDLAMGQNTKLGDALKSLRETEEIAAEVNQELLKNRKTIQNAQANVGEMSSMTKDAKGLLGSMMKKWPF